MTLDKQDLIEELKRTLDDIEEQIERVQSFADRQPDWMSRVNEYVPTLKASEIRLPDGSWPMIPLLAAKAQALNALTHLLTS